MICNECGKQIKKRHLIKSRQTHNGLIVYHLNCDQPERYIVSKNKKSFQFQGMQLGGL